MQERRALQGLSRLDIYGITFYMSWFRLPAALCIKGCWNRFSGVRYVPGG